ncbi:MAG TPA: uroporphyrinogen-III C-methyltransferase [Clostridiaceae bacterium]|nr:uroporphyrinogen-III C-methyltransferase [Clostridiaceae bacterium]
MKNDLKKFRGKVYLAGAGPGDPELLTLKAKRAIEEADVIVYDRLTNPNLLNLNMEAQRIYVGKKAEYHHKNQDEINEILYEEACKGKIVTRLKGGDPYVFGRGGEEALYLKDRGVKFEIIPGVTSSIAGPGYAGIPVTFRNIARSFHVITGQRNDNAELNYKHLARLEGSLIFLMGFKNLAKICKGLLEHGKNPKTPVAIIQWAATSRQKVLTGELSNIYEKSRNADIERPAIIFIGDTVSLRDDLNFYEKLPLFGHNIVITREAKRAQSTIQKFQSLGANILSFPMIETVFTDSAELKEAIENIEIYDYIFFTSVNGVDFFMDKFLQESDVRKLSKTKFCTIGIKTYNALKKYGIKADLMPDVFEGMEAVEVLKNHVDRNDRVLVPRARLGRNEIVNELKEFCLVKEIEVYDTLIKNTDKEEIIESLKDYDDYEIIFTSSSTFKNFAEILGTDLKGVLEKGRIISIGPITSRAVEEAGYKVDIEAEESTIEGIIEAIKEQREKF